MQIAKAIEEAGGLTETARADDWALVVDSPTAATLYVRRGRQVAYASRIGFAAGAADLTKKKRGQEAWEVGEEESVLWPLDPAAEDETADVPHPAEVMTWLGWHGVGTLRDIAERCYGIAATTASEWTLRSFVGYAYQIGWAERAGRAPAAAWRARLGALRRLLTTDATEDDARAACERAVHDLTETGAQTVTDTETATEKQPIVKKKAPAASTAKEPAAGAKPTAGKKAPRVKKEKVKKEPKERASRMITDPSTLKASPGDARMTERVKAARTLKVGDRRKYHGRNEKANGKLVTVVGFRPNAGLHVDFEGETFPCSPFSVIEGAKGEEGDGKSKKSKKKAD